VLHQYKRIRPVPTISNYMGKFGLYSDKSSIQFESHLVGLDDQTKTLLLHLRNYVKSLGENVVEEVRPHRVVYAKSLTFRYFLDIQTRKDGLMVSTRRSRKEQPVEHIVKDMQEMDNIKPKISEAYANI
jgi:hypothetical protein